MARLGRASTFCGTAILDWGAFEIHFFAPTQHTCIIFIPKKLLRSLYIAENIEYLRNRSALAVSCEIKSRARNARDLICIKLTDKQRIVIQQITHWS